MTDLDLEEQTARIDHLLAARLQLLMDTQRKQQEFRWYPFVLLITAFGAGIGFLGGVLAGLKAFGVIH